MAIVILNTSTSQSVSVSLLGEIALYWLSGKLNPADVTTKALDKAVTVAHSGIISGQAPIPIPKGCKVWHGPIDKPREIVGV